jgi:hypothetical protein
MVGRSKQSLNASRSTRTSTSSKWTLFNARQISSGQWYIRMEYTIQNNQSRRFLSSKSHWNCALSTTESPMAPPIYNSFTLNEAKMTSTRSRVLGSSLMANSKDHLHASKEVEKEGQLAWCIMGGKVRKSMGHTSTVKVRNMWIH